MSGNLKLRNLLTILACITATLFLSRCQDPEAEGSMVFTVEADSSFLGFGKLHVELIGRDRKDTMILFDDSLQSLEQLRRVPVAKAPDGLVRLVIRGYESGTSRLIFEEERDFNLETGSLVGTRTPLDAIHGISRAPRVNVLAAEPSVRAGDTVTIKVSAHDSDGVVTHYRWFFDADTLPEISDSVGQTHVEATGKWAYSSASSENAVFEAWDDTRNRVRRTFPIQVTPEGRPSVRFLQNDTLLSIADTLRFAAAVRDTDGMIHSFAWDLEGSGEFRQALVLDKDVDTVRNSRVFPDTGAYLIILKVTDDLRKETRDTLKVRISLDAPWADAGKDTLVVAGDSVRLWGRGSDNLGTVTLHEWKIGKAGFTAAPGGTAGFRSPSDSGTLLCVLRVTDDDGLTATDTMSVRTIYSSDANLADLDLSGAAMVPDYQPGIAVYAATVPFSHSSINLRMRRAQPQARVFVAGVELGASDTSAQVAIQVGSNTIPVAVLAQNGMDQRAYTLFVARRPNHDASLESLKTSSGSLEPSFTPDSLKYGLRVPFSQQVISLTPVARDDLRAKIRVNGSIVASGSASAPIPLAVGENILSISVTAHDDTITQVYRVSVNRLPSPDAVLKSLIPSAGTLAPAFDGQIFRYSLILPNAIDGIAFQAAPNDAMAKAYLLELPLSTDRFSDTVPLAVGRRDLAFTVVAQNSDSAVYHVEVRRKSANSNLELLQVSEGTLRPAFAPGVDSSFTDTVAYPVSTIRVTAVAADSNVQWIKIGGTLITGRTASRDLTLSLGSNVIIIRVKPEDGDEKTYFLTVFRIADGDAKLKTMEATSGNWSTPFHPDSLTYTLVVPSAISRIAFRPSANHPATKIHVDGQAVPSGNLSDSIPIAWGKSLHEITGTAENGSMLTYAIWIHRLSPVADLGGISVSAGTLLPPFKNTITTYTDTVPAETTTVTVSAVAAYSFAQSILIKDALFEGANASFRVSLAIGPNAIPIVVTAEDGTKKNYGLSIFRRDTVKTVPTAVDTLGDVGYSASIAIGTDGHPIIAYLDATNADLKVVKCGSSGCASGNTVTRIDSTGLVGTWDSPSIKVPADGLPVISYFDETNQALKVAKCGNASCSAGNTLTSVVGGSRGSFTSLFIGPDGLPVIACGAGVGMVVVKCGNAKCNEGNAINTADAGPYGYENSLFVPPDSLPIVSHSPSSGVLRVTKCGNRQCSAGNSTRTFSVDAGRASSIWVPADGLPFVAYTLGNSELRFVKCLLPDCSAVPGYTTVATAHSGVSVGTAADGLPLVGFGNADGLWILKCSNIICDDLAKNRITKLDGIVASGVSMVVPPDKKPVLSYYSNGDLKVMKCASVDCAP